MGATPVPAGSPGASGRAIPAASKPDGGHDGGAAAASEPTTPVLFHSTALAALCVAATRPDFAGERRDPWACGFPQVGPLSDSAARSAAQPVWRYTAGRA